MATSVKEIYDNIISYKNSREELDGLNSTSQVAIYTMWAYVTSVIVFTHEVLWDLFRVEIETAISQRINGTSGWYALKALEYQDGDVLQVLDGGTRLGYASVIEDNQIITRAAYEDTVVGSEGQLDLKLATGEPDSLAPLTGSQRSSVEKYFNDIKFAGTNLNIVSIRADEVLINPNGDPTGTVAIYHDGARTNAKVQSDIEDAMDAFFINLDFNGIFYIEEFRDSLQVVDGVVDVEITALTMRDHVDDLVPNDTLIDRKITLASGYGKVSAEEKAKLIVEVES